jgi:hypothetical protein
LVLLLLLLLLPAVAASHAGRGLSHSSLLAGIALHKKDAERSLQDIETTLLVCAQQCALDDEEEVSMLLPVWSLRSPGGCSCAVVLCQYGQVHGPALHVA